MSTVEQKAGGVAVEERPATSGSNNQVCKSCTLETETAERGTKRKLGADVSGLCKKPTTDAVAVASYSFKGYVAERQGEREEMQDAHVVLDTFLSPDTESQLCCSYYAVFDGHGGTRASKHAAEHLHRNLKERLPKDASRIEADIKKCFIDVFKKTDEEFLKLAKKNKPVWKDGSTAVAVLAINSTLYIANLGDSKAVLCRFDAAGKMAMPIPLTKDHNATLYDERKRIQKAGGKVIDGRVMGVLEVSRSIGDGPYKKHGVSCIPDIKRCQLTENDRYVLIACDGLWKAFDNRTAIEFINKVLNDPKIEKMAEKYEAACSRLASEAVRKLSADNVTVMLVHIANTR
ncbi:hypothetical protein NP493_286g01045 [Ridgeia piscesae]|uniref:PPM-type phosphatase domain-containing protein n=1 Tax=Ridgeia piscesae TaxID=27915 RepID=A0AAD9UCA1_RIDPI|nr:hypothetical protein NP493_286g01045 [Ridgeia piscesae]